MIDLSHVVSGMFDGGAFSTYNHDISTELSLVWFICHIMCEQCWMVKHCLHSITIFQRNSLWNEWFVTWCVRNVGWWSIVYMPSGYFNGTLVFIIYLSRNVWGMFDGGALSTFHHNISTELFLEWMICHMMCQECWMVKHCLHAITIFQRNSSKYHLFLTQCVRNVRWWSIAYMRSRYFNGTLVRMIHLSHDVSGMFDGEALSTSDHDNSTELWSEWYICHMMCQECSMVKHCLHPITIIQRNSGQNDTFVTWCVKYGRWWSIVSMQLPYFNDTLFRMIDLSLDVWGIFDGGALSTFHYDISTELYLDWLICHMMCEKCSTGKCCLHSITILQRNSD